MYQDAKGSWIKHIDFMILDILCLEIAFFLAYVTRHGLQHPFGGQGYVELAVAIVLVDLCVVFFRESYRGIIRRGFWQEFKAVISHVSIVVLLTIFYMFLIQSSDIYSRIVFVLAGILGIGISYTGRQILKVYVRSWLERHKTDRTIIAVTSHELADKTLAVVRKREYRDYRITGFVIMDQDMRGQSIRDVPVVASSSDALEYMKREVVDEVFVNFQEESELPIKIMEGCSAMGIIIHTNLMKLSVLQGNKSIEHFGEFTVMTTSMNRISRRQLMFKRSMDIAGGIVGGIITLIAAVFVAPIIYVQSPGPILFTQTRIGKNGRPFKIYKFRSMYMDAEERKKELMAQNEMQGHLFKMKNDPRIFPFGHFIRKTSIDELPQFFNVLKGEMSLVGTRPPTVDEYEHYELWHKKRLAIKPGLTGMWQVSGRSDIVDFEEVVELDTKYISDFSLGLDMRILLKTIKVVLGKTGAK